MRLIGKSGRGTLLSMNEGAMTFEAGQGDRSRARARQARLLAGGMLAAALLIFVWEMRSVPPQADDAFISYRYARNLVRGEGLVYNPGERVEGYTNLLWTLLIAASLDCGLSAENSAHLLSLASGLGVLLLAFLYTRALIPGPQAWLAGLTPLLVLASPSFAIWSTSGMETPLFTALVTGSVLAEARGRRYTMAISLWLAVFTRPEGLIAAATLFAYILYRERSSLRRAFGPLLVYGGTVAALVLFRLLYYGDLVPNTFYARAGGLPPETGLIYLAGCLASGPAMLVAPAFFGSGCRGFNVAWPGATLVAAFCLYIALIGGDAFNGWRFFLPVLPVLVALALRGCALVLAASRTLGMVVATCLPAIALFYLAGSQSTVMVLALVLASMLYLLIRRPPYPRRERLAAALVALGVAGVALGTYSFERANRSPGAKATELAPPRSRAVEQTRAFLRFGRWLARHQATFIRNQCDRDCLVAAIALGMLGYYSEARIVDLLGLIDPVIARSPIRRPFSAAPLFPGHARSNAAYVLSRDPDFILIGDRADHELPARSHLVGHPEFQRRYRYDPRLYGFSRRRFPKRVSK